MAKITIAGEAIVVTSSLKLEDIKKVEKYRPKALYLMGGEDGKEPIFRVSAPKRGEGSINKVGAEFVDTTHDDDKLACITMIFTGESGEDIKEAVADEIGVAILNLNKIEAAIPGVLREIEAEKASVMENITVAR